VSDTQWLQASLPVKDGGLGIRRAASLALPAFLASAASTSSLQDSILALIPCPSDSFFDTYLQSWSSSFGCSIPTDSLSSKQSFWDRPGVLQDRAIVEAGLRNSEDRARFLAAASPHSGDWLHALPIAACGLRLDDEAVRVAVGLRLGINLCVPHTCRCGAEVDARGLHGLTCKLAPGRIARHQVLNDLVSRAFASASIPVTKEPVGLLRSDGKRPDGLTLVPWQSGKPLTWDVTVTHTLAASYLSSSAREAGAAAELAANRKSAKYADLPQSHLFQPIALETLGSMNSSTVSFFSDLSRRISTVSGDIRESSYLFQRIAITIQRFNSVLFGDSFLPGDDFDF